MYGLEMNELPESLEGRVIANLMQSWRRNPLIMAEIIEEGKADEFNGRNIMAIRNGIIDYRMMKSKKRKDSILRKRKALSLLGNFTAKEVSIITGLGITTISNYVREQTAVPKYL